MDNQITPFGIRRNLDYILENFKLMLVRAFQYRTNFYSMIFLTILGMCISYFSLYVISSNFGSLISWKFEDFLLISIISHFIWGVMGLFQWGRVLNDIILFGNLNGKLTKPLPNSIKFYFNPIHETGFILLILSIFYAIILFFIHNFQLENIFLLIFGTIILNTFYLLFFFTIDSLDFYYRNLSNPIRELIWGPQTLLQNYPGQYFSNFKFKNILFLFPVYYLSMFLIPISQGHINYNLFIYLLLAIFLFGVLLKINWHYGLKRYEAYG